MEEQSTSTKSSTDSLFCVTPLSKYLAMLLMLILPFVGAYLGYALASEKVVEVERVVVKEMEVEKEDTVDTSSLVGVETELNLDPLNPDVYEPFHTLKVGDDYKDLAFLGFENNNLGTDIAVFGGEFELTGNLNVGDGFMSLRFILNQESLSSIPLVGSVEDYEDYANCLFVDGIETDDSFLPLTTSVDLPAVSATTTIVVEGLRIFDPVQSNWCHETTLVRVK